MDLGAMDRLLLVVPRQARRAEACTHSSPPGTQRSHLGEDEALTIRVRQRRDRGRKLLDQDGRHVTKPSKSSATRARRTRMLMGNALPTYSEVGFGYAVEKRRVRPVGPGRSSRSTTTTFSPGDAPLRALRARKESQSPTARWSRGAGGPLRCICVRRVGPEGHTAVFGPLASRSPSTSGFTRLPLETERLPRALCPPTPQA